MVKIPVVNEEDEVIALKEKKDLLLEDINRDTGLWILDEEGNILLGRRSANKKIHPNLWAVAASGTVEEGESYESNILKEAYEEIGLKDIKPIFLYKFLKLEDKYKRMSGVFKVNIKRDTEFKLEPMEVSEIKWFSVEEIKELIQTKPEMFTKNFPKFFEEFMKYENQAQFNISN